MKTISGGICAAQGFKASGVHCGIRKNKAKKDLALIVSETKCSTACVYTKNLVKGAPIAVTQKNISDGYASAVICNSGNANTCNANGIEIAEGMCSLVEKTLGIPASDVVVASTGVIGQEMSLDPIASGMDALAAALASGEEASQSAAAGIMTTDTKLKETAVEFELSGKTCHMGVIAKGSGMIHPNMATMLCFITSDVAISPKMLKKALSADIVDTFNMVTVDRDTSTNDMVCIMCNGLAGNQYIEADGADFDVFCKALNTITVYISKSIAGDGEGASKLLECNVSGSFDKHNAKTIARSVVSSNLVKAAMFGADANCGRVLCAVGYSGASVDVSKISVDYVSKAGSIRVCANGNGLAFDEELAKKILLEDEIQINVALEDGDASATAWGCDLTYDYVKINGDYRT